MDWEGGGALCIAALSFVDGLSGEAASKRRPGPLHRSGRPERVPLYAGNLGNSDPPTLKEKSVKQIRKRVTYANVMSSIAVFLVLGGGAAYAAKKIGSNEIKGNSITTGKIKKNAVTASKIKKNSIVTAKINNGAVTGAKIAAGAVGATQLANGSVGGSKLANGSVSSEKIAANAVGNSQTQFVKVFKAGAVPAIGEETTSPKIELGSVGPFHFYGKCFKNGANVEEKTYIELTSGAATLDSEDAAEFDSNSTGYLTPTTPESERAMEDEATAGANSFGAESSDEEFQASASDGTEITGLIGGTGAKQGSPPEGNGPFLAGDSCIVGTIAIFGS